MSFNIKALKEELEQTKKDLQQLREKEFQKQRLEPDKEDFMFIENATKVGFKEPNEEPANYEFQKKRIFRVGCVTTYLVRIWLLDLIGEVNSGAHSHLIHHINHLRQRDWEVGFQHVYREANLVADSLAKWDSSGHVGGRIFYSVPGDLRNLWQHDRGTLHGTLLASTAAGMN
ncbi:hypothetical protein V6N11_052342 [Hibiscus sabdariffa]|uniref:RNase H type-1 domain-containing protein n=1 Tax=Hibiscus sabdariffa TaxID=183260 RepID=A0ABR2U9R4_9ROSI